jgi:hypothetical protein
MKRLRAKPSAATLDQGLRYATVVALGAMNFMTFRSHVFHYR